MWHKRKEVNAAFEFFVEMSNSFSNMYDYFEYDSERGVYVTLDSDEYSILFVNGKLSKIEEIEDRGICINIYSYQATNYSKTEVELPLIQ